MWWISMPFAVAEVPLGTFEDCGERDRPDLCPDDLGERWNYLSYVPGEYLANTRPEEHSLGSGLWADRAWRLTTGSTDVLIAVLDSGIEWDEAGLLRKHFLNIKELPKPEGSNKYDVDGNGVVNIDDYAADSRVDITAGVDAADHLLDPSDLIHTFSDGVDDDGNGFVDDISGWDFYRDDNDPYDDQRYGHGTGESKDSAEEGGDGAGGIGVCPNCMVVNLRVSDSFVSEGQRFGSATIYAVDLGASVVQEALGALNNSVYVQQAIDYAWNRDVIVIGSAADENHWHHNFPGVNHHTVYVHAIRYDAEDRSDATSWLSYSNCTNHGPRLDLSAPSTSCSSGATGMTSGVAGLLMSASLQADVGLSANEAFHLLNNGADDIFIADAHPIWYPTKKGWDRYSGNGRVNAWRSVKNVLEGDIPPETDLLGPSWFRVYDPARTPTLPVVGRIRSDRTPLKFWKLEVAVGDQPQPTAWTTVASGSEPVPVHTELTQLDLTALELDADAAIPAYDYLDDQVRREDVVNGSTVTLRLTATDVEGRKGVMRRAFAVREDPDAKDGFPLQLDGSLESSPVLVDVDGDGVQEIVIGDGYGRIHAIRGDGEELDGWPVVLDPVPTPPLPAAIDATPGEAVLGRPAVGDLDGDGSVEIVAGTLTGGFYVLAADGSIQASWQPDDVGPNSPGDHRDFGFHGAPVLGDLDGDGDLEIAVGAMDQQLYAWHHDGKDVTGFPVPLEFPTADENARITSSAALGDLDGDGTPEIVIGTNEPLSAAGALYVVKADGSFLDGWPRTIAGLAESDVLPWVGRGVPGSPALVDFDEDGDLEIVISSVTGFTTIYGHDGTELHQLSHASQDYGPFSNVSDATFVTVSQSPSIGDLDRDGVPDIVSGGTGINYLLAQQDDGRFYDLDHAIGAWSGADYGFFDGFPQVIEDIQFFLNPAVGDIDGDEKPEVLAGSGGYLVHAWDRDGKRPQGWPKQTSQWIIGTPALGDIDGDGTLDVVVGTRHGALWAWTTKSPAGAHVDWPMFGRDTHNTHDYSRPLEGYNTGYPVDAPEEDTKGCGCTTSRAGLYDVLSLFRRR